MMISHSSSMVGRWRSTKERRSVKFRISMVFDFDGFISLEGYGEGVEGGFSFVHYFDGAECREDVFGHVDNDPEPVPSR